jgi:Zincin-like metallopeptidase
MALAISMAPFAIAGAGLLLRKLNVDHRYDDHSVPAPSMSHYLMRKSLRGRMIRPLRGVPLPRRSSTYSGVLPDKISIFGGPITRLATGAADRLRREVRHVVLHEIARHFGISDERLIELDRY